MNLKDFAGKLQTLAGDKVEKDVFFKRCTDALAGDVLRRARKYTPVGEGVFEPVAAGAKPKRSHYSWKRVDDETTGRTYWKAAKAGKDAKLRLRRVRGGGALRLAWFAEPAALSVYGAKARVINPSRYASYVEYGHRQHVGQFVPVLGKRLVRPWVDGRFMLRRAHEETKARAAPYLSRELHHFIRRNLNDDDR